MGAFVPSDIKYKNRETLFSLLRSGAEISRAELARTSGISAPTVLKIIDYFTGLNLVRETGEGVGSLGRRPQLLRFEPRAAFAIGCEYDGLNLATGVVDLSGNVLSLVRRRASPDSVRLVANELEPAVAEALVAAGVGRDKVVGLGLGLPGTVGESGRDLRFAPLVGIGKPVDLRATIGELEGRLGFPLVLENDANTAALGEFSARGMNGGDLVFVVLGRGIGAGIILDGKLRRGPRGFAGELGYLVFDPAWTSSIDAPGWLEQRIDLGSLASAEASDQPGPGKDSLSRIASDLALGLSSLAVSLDVSLIVLGGSGCDRLGPELLPRVRSALSRLSILEIALETPVAPEPGVSGSASLAVDRWLTSVFAG